MLNKIKHAAQEGTSKFIKAVAIVGTTLLITLNVGANPTNAAVQKEIAEIFKKNPDKEIIVKVESEQENTENVAKFETLGNDPSNALTFATQNVDKYYPDMKEHLTTMMNSFRDEEHQSATIKLLNEMVENISDPAQKTGAIIYALEGIFYKGVFAKKYDSEITDETFTYIEIFDTDYKTRFKGYYERLIELTEQLKKEIISKQTELQNKQTELQNKQTELQNKQTEFDEKMNKFSPQDIKIIPGMKEWMLDIQKFYEDNKLQISDHLQSLFDAAQ